MINVKKLTLSVALILILLPSLQLLTALLPKTSIHGVAIPDKRPALSLKGLKTEKYQKKLTDYLMRGSSLWPWMVKINCFIRFLIKSLLIRMALLFVLMMEVFFSQCI